MDQIKSKITCEFSGYEQATKIHIDGFGNWNYLAFYSMDCD